MHARANRHTHTHVSQRLILLILYLPELSKASTKRDDSINISQKSRRLIKTAAFSTREKDARLFSSLSC